MSGLTQLLGRIGSPTSSVFLRLTNVFKSRESRLRSANTTHRARPRSQAPAKQVSNLSFFTPTLPSGFLQRLRGCRVRYSQRRRDGFDLWRYGQLYRPPRTPCCHFLRPYLVFGRKATLSFTPLCNNNIYPPLFTNAIDGSLCFLFSWKFANITPDQKPVAYSHLYRYIVLCTLCVTRDLRRRNRRMLGSITRHTPPSPIYSRRTGREQQLFRI